MKRENHSDSALTARAIKKKLKALYPDTKFSVTSDNFSMGDSVDIKWTDGPRQETIEAITRQYQHGSFDGMNDCYNYESIDLSLGCPGAKYVMCQRTISPELKEKVESKIKEQYPNYDPYDRSYYGKFYEIEKECFPEIEAKIDEDEISNNAEVASDLEYKVIEDVDTRDNSQIYVVKVVTKVDDFSVLREQMKRIGGYYSRFKKGFIFKTDPTDSLVSLNTRELVEEDTYEEQEKSSNNFSLLDKFASVEIKSTDRFPEEDMEYCKREEEVYNLAHELHTEIYNKAKKFFDEYETETYGNYVTRYGDHNRSAGLSHYEANIKQDSGVFIEKICRYFQNKYNITIENPEWNIVIGESYNKRTEERTDIVSLDYILDNIHEQMGGMSFDEKALNEVKEGMKKCFYNSYRDVWHLEIKGSKMIMDDFYCSYKDSIWKQYEVKVNEGHKAFFEALTHYEYGDVFLHQKYNAFVGCYSIREDTGIYDKHIISSIVINSVKVFKNGKVEIEFKDSKNVRRFAKEYCGYTQQAA